ncbi:formin-like protein 16 [Arachis stenosperma]|uniref:formin-like protein 16 n=1 Tax=Arachis stenosperma TaxID=217475 RepID=UPI0025AD92C5|nr:formin-like protein 16 [Arachis stenosperma]
MASVDVLYLWVDDTVLGEEPLVDAEFITHLHMAKRNAQEAYQRVQEAKAKSRARSGGARAITSPPPPPPPPKNTGTPSQPIVISSSSLPRPPPSVQILSEPEKKKRKTLESDLKTRGQRIIESPPRPKDASGSSSVPPAGPGGAPPEPSGGDSSTPLKK